jgi:hypothetical protein
MSNPIEKLTDRILKKANYLALLESQTVRQRISRDRAIQTRDWFMHGTKQRAVKFLRFLPY